MSEEPVTKKTRKKRKQGGIVLLFAVGIVFCLVLTRHLLIGSQPGKEPFFVVYLLSGFVFGIIVHPILNPFKNFRIVWQQEIVLWMSSGSTFAIIFVIIATLLTLPFLFLQG